MRTEVTESQPFKNLKELFDNVGNLKPWPEIGELRDSTDYVYSGLEISAGRTRLEKLDREVHPKTLLCHDMIDYSMQHVLYWADSKLNTIESIEQDGSNRKVILKGDSLRHPVSLDTFENNLYWVTRRSAELFRQDKFGRGVPELIVKPLPNSGGVKVYHQQKYNISLRNPCHEDQCTHLCVPIPSGYRCLCSDSIGPLQQRETMRSNERHCDATNERPLPAPRICLCRNGGVCQEVEDKLQCDCPNLFHGEFCEIMLGLGRAMPLQPSLYPLLFLSWSYLELQLLLWC